MHAEFLTTLRLRRRYSVIVFLAGLQLIVRFWLYIGRFVERGVELAPLTAQGAGGQVLLGFQGGHLLRQGQRDKLVDGYILALRQIADSFV